MSSYLDPNSHGAGAIVDELLSAASELRAMQIISNIKPVFSKDGNQFCFLLGDNLQEGIAGFGSTAGEAMYSFCTAFWNEKAT